MTSFTYTNGVPDGPDNPSTDQPNMKTNTNSISGLIAVDHVGFNSIGPSGTGGGQHLQVAFNGKNVPGAQTDPTSTLYTNSGLATSISELYYVNQNATFLISCVKAFGSFVVGPGPAFTNQYNCASISVSGFVNFHITLNANVVFGNNVVVIVQASDDSVITWSFANPVLTIVSSSTGATVSFIVLQA
jgi:hypothetical protein